MSLEVLITSLIAAIEANTAALTGGAAPASGTKAAGTKAAGNKAAGAKATGPKNSVESTQAILKKLKDDFSLEQAKSALKSCGLEKMAEVTDANSDAVFKAASELYAQLEEEKESDGDI